MGLPVSGFLTHPCFARQCSLIVVGFCYAEFISCEFSCTLTCAKIAILQQRCFLYIPFNAKALCIMTVVFVSLCRWSFFSSARNTGASAWPCCDDSREPAVAMNTPHTEDSSLGSATAATCAPERKNTLESLHRKAWIHYYVCTLLVFLHIQKRYRLFNNQMNADLLSQSCLCLRASPSVQSILWRLFHCTWEAFYEMLPLGQLCVLVIEKLCYNIIYSSTCMSNNAVLLCYSSVFFFIKKQYY